MQLVTVDELPADSLDSIDVPFMGPTICAGFPSPADDFLEEALGLPRWLVPNPPATFLWRVSGSSVIGAGIHDGDIVVVDRSVERGPIWWTDGAPDLNRRMVKNTEYADWYAGLTNLEKAERVKR